MAKDSSDGEQPNGIMEEDVRVGIRCLCSCVLGVTATIGSIYQGGFR
jgi:hypothetical protein